MVTRVFMQALSHRSTYHGNILRSSQDHPLPDDDGGATDLTFIPKPSPPRTSVTVYQTLRARLPFPGWLSYAQPFPVNYLLDLVLSSVLISTTQEPGIQGPLTKPWVNHAMCLNLYLLIHCAHAMRDMPNTGHSEEHITMLFHFKIHFKNFKKTRLYVFSF